MFSYWKLIWSEHISLFSFYTILPFHLGGFSDLFFDISLDLICFRALSVLSIGLNIFIIHPTEANVQSRLALSVLPPSFRFEAFILFWFTLSSRKLQDHIYKSLEFFEERKVTVKLM